MSRRALSHPSRTPAILCSASCNAAARFAEHLLPYFGKRRMDAIGAADVELYKARKLKERQSPKSVNNHLTVLRKLLNLAGRVGRDRPRAADPRAAGPERGLPVPHVRGGGTLPAAAAPEWKPFLTVAMKTGLRVGELLALRWEDVDLIEGRIVVRRSLWRDVEGSPKSGRSREVPLSRATVAALKAHRHLKGPYVFCEADGARLTHSRVKDVVPQACKRAGLAKRITWHGLRHTFASHLVMRGASLKAVQELLGHESIEMTLRYSHLTPDVRRATVRLLDTGRGDVGETGSAAEQG